MTRRLITGSDVAKATSPAGAPPVTKDTFMTQVIKLIPSDIIGAFLLIDGVFRPANTDTGTGGEAAIPGGNLTYWLVFGLFLVITPLYLWFIARAPEMGLPASPSQVVLGTVAFLVWVFAIGGPFATTDWYHPAFGTVAGVIFALVAAIVIAVGNRPQSQP